MPTFNAFDSEGVRRRLLAYLGGQIGSAVEVGPLKRFTVGFSWVTYGFSARWRESGEKIARELILRVGPPHGIFAPYRATPEFLTLQTLARGDVPAPRVYWACEDLEVLGAPFFICEFVEGEAPIPWSGKGGGFDEATRLNLGDQFIATLAALHRIDWRDTPAAAIGGARSLDRTAASEIEDWEGRMRAWSPRRHPMLEWALLWFRAHAPKARRISLVHGDYRIGNFLQRDGRIVAILDWELVHLGDPLEDLGWVCLQAWRGRSPHMCRLLAREELQTKYEALTGEAIDLVAWRYWEAFGTFKLAVMHIGAAYCFETRGFDDLRMAGMGAQLPRVLLQLETALEQAA